MRNLSLLFILSLFFIQCAKDQLIEENASDLGITNNSLRTNNILNQYQTDFDALATNYNVSSPQSYKSPLALDVAWDENFYYTADTSLVLLTAYPGNGQTEDNAYDVILMRDSLGNLNAYSMIWMPDALYYDNKGWAPSIWDFTGDVVIYDINGDKEIEYRFEEAFDYYLIGENGEEDVTLGYPVIPPEICNPIDGWLGTGSPTSDCFDFTRGRFWRSIGDGFRDLGKWFSKNWNRYDASNYDDPWADARFAVQSNVPRFGYYGRFDALNELGSGGSNFIESLECWTSCFWCGKDFDVKKFFQLTVPEVFNHYGLNLCEEVNGSGFGDNCLNYYEILCLSEANGCLDHTKTLEEIRQCLYSTFAPDGYSPYPPISVDCDQSLEMFFLTFGLTSVDPNKFVSLAGGETTGICDETEEVLCEQAFDYILDELIEEGMDFPCTNNAEYLAIMNNLKSANCPPDPNENLRDIIEEAIRGNFDWIQESEAFQDCNLIKCVFDILKTKAGYLWCDTYDQFNNNPFRNVKLDVGGGSFLQDPFTLDPTRNAVTGLGTDDLITVAFNPSLCDQQNPDLIRLAKTILHEGLHADMWQYVSDNLMPGQTLGDIGQTTFNEVFSQLFTLICEDTDLSHQHQAMMHSYIDIIAESLHEFNGGIGESDDYLYLAWLGVYRGNDPCVESIISDQEYIDLQTCYNNNVSIHSSVNCD